MVLAANQISHFLSRFFKTMFSADTFVMQTFTMSSVNSSIMSYCLFCKLNSLHLLIDSRSVSVAAFKFYQKKMFLQKPWVECRHAQLIENLELLSSTRVALWLFGIFLQDMYKEILPVLPPSQTSSSFCQRLFHLQGGDEFLSQHNTFPDSNSSSGQCYCSLFACLGIFLLSSQHFALQVVSAKKRHKEQWKK